MDIPKIDAPTFPVSGNELHLGLTSKLNFNGLLITGQDQSSRAAMLNLAGQAQNHHAACLTLTPDWVAEVDRELGPTRTLRLQALIGARAGSPQEREEELQLSLRAGADEVAVIPDLQLLKSGQEKELTEQLRRLVEQAGDVPLKMVLETPQLTDEEIRRAANVAEQAGVRFLRTDSGLPDNLGPLFGERHRTPLDQARLLKEATSLPIEFSGGVLSLADCQAISRTLSDRRLRFESPQASDIVAQETEQVRQRRLDETKALAAEMKADEGHLTLRERENLLHHFEEKIARAHAQGQPVVYLSVPVRTNDAADFDSNLEKAHQLVQATEARGVAYVDPFEVEGTPILTSKGISHRAVQELLMDPASGLWPRVLAKCDAIAHTPNWRFSTGAREEQLMADAWGIPLWDGQSALTIKSDKPEDGGFYLSF
jgi:deoxyribose-phosphate aldolase